jgi:DNA-binding NtrC family response regulator
MRNRNYQEQLEICEDIKHTTSKLEALSSKLNKKLEKKRIIVIDDDIDWLIQIGRVFNGLNFKKDDSTIVYCQSLYEAEKEISKNSLAGIICDYNMPQSNGFNFIEEAKVRYGVKCPVLFMSGIGLNLSDEPFKENPNWEFCQKPVNPDEAFKILSNFAFKALS